MTTFLAKDLAAALKIVALVTPRASNVPVVMTARIDAAGRAAMIGGMNMDCTITAGLAATEGASVWAACVNLRALLGAIDAKGAPITLALGDADTDANVLIVTQGARTGRLTTWPVADFPVWKPVLPAVSYYMDAPALLRGLDCVAYAISTEETRYYLCGVCWDTDEKTLKLVATDGHQMAVHDTGLPSLSVQKGGTILPGYVVKTLRALLKKHEGRCVVGLTETRFSFAVGNVVLTSKVIDGNFPEWRFVMPAGGHTVILRGDAAEIAAFAAGFLRVAREPSRPLALSCRPDGSVHCKVRTDAEEMIGAAPMRAEFSTDKKVPPRFTDARDGSSFGAQLQYIRNVMAVCVGAVEIHADQAAPWLILSEDGATRHVLMPMRT